MLAEAGEDDAVAGGALVIFLTFLTHLKGFCVRNAPSALGDGIGNCGVSPLNG